MTAETAISLDTVDAALAAAAPRLDRHEQRLAAAVLRLLSAGEPVSIPPPRRPGLRRRAHVTEQKPAIKASRLRDGLEGIGQTMGSGLVLPRHPALEVDQA